MRFLSLCFALSVSIALPTSVCAQEVAITPQQQEARTAFEAGVAAFDRGAFPEALKAFEASLASHHAPNTVLMIARTQRELGQPVLAARWFDDALASANDRLQMGEADYTETLKAAREERDRARAEVGTIRFRLPLTKLAAKVTFEGESRAFQNGVAGPFYALGPISYTLHVPGRPDKTRPAVVRAGEELILDQPTEDFEDPSSSVPLILKVASGSSLALGAVLVATGIGFFAAAGSTHDEVEALCPKPGSGDWVCPGTDVAGLVQDGRSFSDTGLPLVVIGGILGLGGALVFGVTFAGESSTSVALTPNGIQLTSRF